MEYFLNVAIAISLPLLFYFVIAYTNRKFKQMDQAMERRTEAATLTTTELQALVHDAVSESLEALLARTERNELRLETMERLVKPPEHSQRQVEAHQSVQGAALLGQDTASDEVDLDEALPSQKRIHGSPAVER